MKRYAPDTHSTAPTWHRLAACAQLKDPELMFPGIIPADIEAARAVCAGCPAYRACLRDVITQERGARAELRYGVRAGLTGPERLAVYRVLRRQGRI